MLKKKKKTYFSFKHTLAEGCTEGFALIGAGFSLAVNEE